MRFVSPETVRIDLRDDPDGTKNWIEIKKRLAAGETHVYRTAGFGRVAKREGAEETEVNVDWKAMRFARAYTYLVDWSATTPTGKTLPITMATIEALDPEQFKEIDDAILAHIASLDDEKNAQRSTSAAL